MPGPHSLHKNAASSILGHFRIYWHVGTFRQTRYWHGAKTTNAMFESSHVMNRSDIQKADAATFCILINSGQFHFQNWNGIVEELSCHASSRLRTRLLDAWAHFTELTELTSCSPLGEHEVSILIMPWSHRDAVSSHAGLFWAQCVYWPCPLESADHLAQAHD